MVTLRDRIPHPLIDADQMLHLDSLLPPGTKPSMSSILQCIYRAFQDKVLKELKPEQCINYSVKLQYYYADI